MAVSLKDEKLLDSWGVVMENGAGKQDEAVAYVTQRLHCSELPGVAWKKVEVQPGMLKGLFGKRRDYLMITSEALKDYRMYFGARDYGKHLDISWFLTVEPGFFKSAFSAMLAHGNINALSFSLDIFDNQDLRAYVTCVHRCCVRQAVEQIGQELQQDTSKFNWQSKGFLQVW
jgi:hypothetical protein